VRRRLLTSTLTIVIVTVALFGIPLAFVLDRLVHDDAQARVDREVTRVAQAASKPGTLDGSEPDVVARLRALVPSDDDVIVRFGDGRTLSTSTLDRNALVANAPGPAGAQITLRSPVEDVNTRVERGLLALVLVAVVALAGALALSLLQSSRLVRPLARVARSATRLGEGDFSLATPRSGVSEIDEIAVALDQSAARIDRLLQTERSFSSHASHQLRSALTGLELRLEEIGRTDDPEIKAEVEAALEQTTRLEHMIDELLALARTGRAGIVTTFDLSELARQHTADIRPVLERNGRRVVVDAPGPVAVVAAVGAIGHIFDILFSNALRHGEGTVTVRVHQSASRAWFDVEDEGPGVDTTDLDVLIDERATDQGHGIGLSLARTLTAAEGGTVAIVRAQPPVFRVELPVG
jgi:signal transduction histidine kinase